MIFEETYQEFGIVIKGSLKCEIESFISYCMLNNTNNVVNIKENEKEILKQSCKNYFYKDIINLLHYNNINYDIIEEIEEIAERKMYEKS